VDFLGFPLISVATLFLVFVAFGSFSHISTWEASTSAPWSRQSLQIEKNPTSSNLTKMEDN
jgi:hypothetical protein